MHERPHRAVIDRETALGRQFGHQAAQSEGATSAARDQPVAMLARHRARLMTAHLTRCDASGLPKALIQPMAVLIATPKCAAA